ncbi:MAG TPA: DmsC/YnfH family molybdoenzyme membrane anchor subunit, partial [Opitutaceae bacterium]|nr:DmsC/YnfH family molybdoenzyme membrane anchor subunit [Opitutaceae bacterium]
GLRATALSVQLVPLTAPGPGEQYAFEVDLDSCTGCKACVAGCHALNGLDEEETWRDTGLLVGGDERHPFQQTVTTACHHCADPGCLNGCPVLAYEKDPATGIVRHLDDQCIGCSYCVLKCPYDVPKYSSRLGIVRKCDMCHQRLGAGEAPACVQACPTHAIKIVNVSVTRSAAPDQAAPAGVAGSSAFLPTAPDPSYTQPTTRYVTRRALPADLRPADQNMLRPQPAHWPLTLMLVCTQTAVGLQAARELMGQSTGAPPALGWAAVGFAAAGLAASVAHLGQPLRAWRVFLGLRRSWLSREAVVFGAWFPALVLSVATDLLAPAAGRAALFFGAVGVYCSAMIYVDTRRHAWRAAQSVGRFLGTAAVAGTAGAFAAAPSHAAVALLVLAVAAKFGLEARAARPAAERDADDPLDPALATARLLTGRFHLVFGLRFTLPVAGVLLLTYATAGATAAVSRPAAFAAGLLLLLGGEVAERHLYFRTVDAPKMPGYAGREAKA